MRQGGSQRLDGGNLCLLCNELVCSVVCGCARPSVRPSVALAEGRRPDKRDEAARAMLVSSTGHHPSSWELSA